MGRDPWKEPDYEAKFKQAERERELWKNKYEDLVGRQGKVPPPNKRGTLDDVGKKHVKQTTGHSAGALTIVGVWYALLQQANYLGAEEFFSNEHVVAVHSFLFGGMVAWFHKTFSGEKK